MRTIPIDQIIIPPDRQRKEGKDTKSLTELKSDIAELGLYHAPVITENNELVIGERRLLAMKELHEEGITFFHDGEVVPKGEIPYTRFIDALKLKQLKAELHENIRRLNLTWQEESLAKVRIHEMLVAENPEHTKIATAQVIVQASEKPVTKENVNVANVQLARAITVAKHLDNPVIASQPNVTKAYNAVLDLQRQSLERDLIKLRPASVPHTLIQADALKHMRTLPDATFDLILSDPPYGINAHKHTDGTTHNYDDSPGYALDLYRFILRRGFDLLKPQGAIFLFCDIEHFLTLRLAAEQLAYSTWRTPVIWHKGPEGHAPWGRDGFKRTYEIGLYAVKGQRPMILNGGSDVKLVTRPTVNVQKLHAAEKPPELLRWLLQLLVRSGDKVLDPCCGSAPIFPAAKGLGIHITAIEKNPEYHAAASSRLLALDQESAPVDHVEIKPTMDELLENLMGD